MFTVEDVEKRLEITEVLAILRGHQVIHRQASGNSLMKATVYTFGKYRVEIRCWRGSNELDQVVLTVRGVSVQVYNDVYRRAFNEVDFLKLVDFLESLL